MPERVKLRLTRDEAEELLILAEWKRNMLDLSPRRSRLHGAVLGLRVALSLPSGRERDA